MVVASKEITYKTKRILSLSAPINPKPYPPLPPLPLLPSPPPPPRLLLLLILPELPTEIFQKVAHSNDRQLLLLRNCFGFRVNQLGCHRCDQQRSSQSNSPGSAAVDRQSRQLWRTTTPQRDSTGKRQSLSRSFWQPHKIVKAITITLLAAVAAIKRPSRCIAVA